MIETLYYTIHNYVEEFGEGSVINLYKIKDNRPLLISELTRDLDGGWTPQEELEYHIEDWPDDGTTYIFEQL